MDGSRRLVSRTRAFSSNGAGVAHQWTTLRSTLDPRPGSEFAAHSPFRSFAGKTCSVDTPETRSTRSGEAHIAYQVVGQGPDLSSRRF
jgi:hypothetical protein